MTGVFASALIPSESGIEDKFSTTEKFLSLFPHRDTFICKLPNQDSWRKWTGPLQDWQILGVIGDGGRGGILRGCYWAPEICFAVLDIDAGSKYHNARELEILQQKLAAVGLSIAPYRSSESGGWHLYLFLDCKADRHEVESTIKAWLKANRYEIKGGTLEVFPSGNALRLPLQPGFAWLDQQGRVIRTREEMNRDEAIASFLHDREKTKRNWSEAKNRIERQLNDAASTAGGDVQARQERLETGGFDELFSGGKIQDRWENGRNFWQEGLSSAGQRHDAVLFIGHYLWYGDPENGIAALAGARNDEYRAKLIEDWLTEKHNGFCRHLDQNKWETIRAQIKRAVLWRGNQQAKDYEPYRLTDRLLKRLLDIYRKTGRVLTVEDFKQANEDRRDEARCKIRAAVEQCFDEGRQISRKTLQFLTGCSPNTLRKHGDLWKLFAAGSGEYNPGGLGGSSVLGSDRFEEKREQEFLDPSSPADSGDLGCVHGSCSEELAPIVLTSPFLLPGSEPTSEPPASSPSPSGAFGSLDPGAPVRRYSGRTADGAGDLEPSCNAVVNLFAWSRQRHAAKDRSEAKPHRTNITTRAKCIYHTVRQDKRRTAYAPGLKHYRSFKALPGHRSSTQNHCRCRYGSCWLGLSTLPRAPPNHRPEPRTFKLWTAEGAPKRNVDASASRKAG